MSEEPIGVMNCWECVEKHTRDLEHHLEDIVRVSEARERIKYEDWIDFVREIRKFAHKRAKGIAVEPLPVKGMVPEAFLPHSSNPAEPIRVERGEKTWVEVFHEKEECERGSFRVVKPNPEHLLTICCPTGQYDKEAGMCLVGTMAQKLEHLHAEGEGSCLACGGA